MSLHGYELFQKLETFGFHPIDQGSLYGSFVNLKRKTFFHLNGILGEMIRQRGVTKSQR
ncbi:hypothetical protein ACE198_21835 [Neobacillus sp. KR4-4]|uniref:hypothetical protein n=1 Tax=Neobacillus sp. KR4-4 TaxID=3344872 RepID=UPI0035C97AED